MKQAGNKIVVINITTTKLVYSGIIPYSIQ